MKSLHLFTKSFFGIVALLVLVGASISPAAAQTPSAAQTSAADGSRLEYGLKRAEIRLDVLEDRIENVTSAANLVEEFIQDEKDDGHDTAAMEDALAELRAKLIEAEAAANVAAQAIDEKAGFDDDGRVTDAQQALETVQGANRAIRDGNQALRSGAQDLRRAVRDYRLDKWAGR